MSHLNYFAQTKLGNSKWWTWPLVFWCMLMTWIIGQVILTSGFGSIATGIDPELGTAFNDAAMAGFADVDMARFGFSTLGFLISSVLAFVMLLISYNTSGTAQRVTGIICGIGVAGTFISLYGLAPMMSGGEALNAVFNQLLGRSPLAYALMLLTFPGALVGLYLGYKFIHKRTITALHTGFAKFRWKRTFTAFFVMWGVLFTAGMGLSLATGNAPSFVFDAGMFFKYALISLLLLPIQSATEEIIFRGYLNQGLIHFFKNKWVAFTITSALFMAMHLANPEALAGAKDGILPIVMSGYFFFGFAACLLILIDDGLESAIGVHAGNNTFAALFVNYENSVLPTPSIWQVKANPVMDSIATIVILSIVVAIMWWINQRQKSALAA
ncbi:lysostaphin resistance A-like protein [Litorimonas sp. RW-G-Af-16]|uniref:CPBP family intramembrane glutamic endopeptidase n=1 Tax=Litorimonas sp. RW-G-Af-16 TaxID=3241168 RepID=UPI00390C448C